MPQLLENSIHTVMVCVFCSNEVEDNVCLTCNEYKGVMTVAAWEEYTGDKWDDEATVEIDVDSDEDDQLVCVFCDVRAEDQGRFMFCPECQDIDGLRTIPQWEESTGEKWED